MSRSQRFSCRIQRGEGGQVACLTVSLHDSDTDQTLRTVSVNGHRAERISGALHDILRGGGVTGRQWSSTREIDLEQTTGAHAWLLVEATRPLRRGDRLEEVGDGVARMSREEASYWYAKSHQPRGLRAIRLLLSDDARRR